MVVDAAREIGEQVEQGWEKQSHLCEVMAEAALILHDEPVYSGDDIVGHCTSGGFGYRSGTLLCLAMFYHRSSLPGQTLQIDIAGERFDLRLLEQPLYRTPRG